MARPRKRAANGSVRENGQALEVTITHDPASVQQSQSKPALETSYKQKYQWVSYNRTGFDGPKGCISLTNVGPKFARYGKKELARDAIS
ncbi:MAG TPA: hypothetical protein VFQ43_20780 [Nitrososphaera sp.]|nr:hypothetical protein [Nitrososphaera sp.]